MAETTPGPLIMVLQFVGFIGAYRDPGGLPPLLAGTLGGLLATGSPLSPCFLWIFLGAPFVEALRGNRAERGAVGDHRGGGRRHPQSGDLVRDPCPVPRDAPCHAAGLFDGGAGVDSVDPWALALTLAALLAVFRFRLGMLQTLAGCAVAGVLIHLAGLRACPLPCGEGLGVGVAQCRSQAEHPEANIEQKTKTRATPNPSPSPQGGGGHH